MIRIAEKEEKEKFRLLQDARTISLLDVGDEAAANWLDDPNFYIGILEMSDGDLGGDLGLDLGNKWGSIDEAFHVVLLKKEKKALSIVVRKRIDDYMAFIEGHTEIWGCGKTPSCAIGDMILSHKDICGIEIKYE